MIPVLGKHNFFSSASFTQRDGYPYNDATFMDQRVSCYLKHFNAEDCSNLLGLLNAKTLRFSTLLPAQEAEAAAGHTIILRRYMSPWLRQSNDGPTAMNTFSWAGKFYRRRMDANVGFSKADYSLGTNQTFLFDFSILGFSPLVGGGSANQYYRPRTNMLGYVSDNVTPYAIYNGSNRGTYDLMLNASNGPQALNNTYPCTSDLAGSSARMATLEDTSQMYPSSMTVSVGSPLTITQPRYIKPDGSQTNSEGMEGFRAGEESLPGPSYLMLMRGASVRSVIFSGGARVDFALDSNVGFGRTPDMSMYSPWPGAAPAYNTISMTVPPGAKSGPLFFVMEAYTMNALNNRIFLGYDTFYSPWSLKIT